MFLFVCLIVAIAILLAILGKRRDDLPEEFKKSGAPGRLQHEMEKLEDIKTRHSDLFR